MKAPKLICIIGAECTGKTTLARALAANFDCPWVPEHLRDFCDTHARTPTRDEQPGILEMQHLNELAALGDATQQEKPFVFCLSLIHISEPTRRTPTSYAVFCLK